MMSYPFRRPPTDLWHKTPAAGLDYEIAREKASALGRLGRALETALQGLAEFDVAHPSPGPAERDARLALVAAAGHVLWEFVVQREACGLRDGGVVMRMYKVPREVQDRMGAFPAPKRRP
jgi:Family of unknown function (DUF6665)